MRKEKKPLRGNKIVIIGIFLIVIVIIIMGIVFIQQSLKLKISNSNSYTEDLPIENNSKQENSNIMEEIEEKQKIENTEKENVKNDEKEKVVEHNSKNTINKKNPPVNETQKQVENETQKVEDKNKDIPKQNIQINNTTEQNGKNEVVLENNTTLANTHFTKYNLEKTKHAVSYINNKIKQKENYKELGGEAIVVNQKPCKNWFSYSYDERLDSLATTGCTIKVYIEDEYAYDSRGINYYLYDTKAFIYQY